MRSKALHIAIISAPLVVLTSVFLWFSQNPITPNPAVEASAVNPAGLLTSNFVYDGSINIENIALSCVFLLLLCLYLPRRMDTYLAYVLPVAVIAAGGLGELTAISAPYISTSVCKGGCSFYGMSGVASAIVGFTFAGFFLVFGLTILQISGRIPAAGGFTSLFGRPSIRREALLTSAFLVYVLLLLVISGVIALPSHSVTSGTGGVSVPPPPAILTQTPPVALVHTASLVYGFLLCFITFFFVNRRFRTVGVRT